MTIYVCTACSKHENGRQMFKACELNTAWCGQPPAICSEGHQTEWRNIAEGDEDMSTEVEKKVVFEPIGDRIVIVPDAAEEETPGGIVLVKGTEEKPQCGEVIAVGPGANLHNGSRSKLQVGVGCRVLFSPYAETVTLAGNDYVLVREGDLYAILR